MKIFFDLRVAEFPANNFENLFKNFNFDFKTSNFAVKPPCNFSMIIYSRKNLKAATAIFERNSGISKFFNQNKNIR